MDFLIYIGQNLDQFCSMLLKNVIIKLWSLKNIIELCYAYAAEPIDGCSKVFSDRMTDGIHIALFISNTKISIAKTNFSRENLVLLVEKT